MNSFFEKLKDYLYDSIDYLIIIVIIIGVVSVIGWRLDVLFAKDTLDLPTPPVIVDERDIDQDDDLHRDEDITDVATDLTGDDEDPAGDPDMMDMPDSDNPENPTTVTVSIPDGTLPSGIGTILENNGLVTSKNDFVIQAQNMALDRRLRSGTFSIPNNATLEEVIRIIANQS